LAPSESSAETRLKSLAGYDRHSLTNVWTGKFTALDGNQFDASQYYQSESNELTVKGSVEFNFENNFSSLVFFRFDNGYRSRLYNVKPFGSFGGGLIFTKNNIGFSLVVKDFLQIGGELDEKSCYDRLDRDFHCGTGLPWTDYSSTQPSLPVVIELSGMILF
jgi:hypothetical protein